MVRVQLKRNDTVKVIAGRDKGKSGRVLDVNKEKGRILVEHVGMIKRHTRPNPAKQIKGGIAEREASIAISNVMIVCPKCGPGKPRGRGFAASADRRSTRSNHMAARLKEFYAKTVIPALTKEFGYKNIMAVPKIVKVSVNIGLGEATQNAKLMDKAVTELTAIAGQKPIITKAKKSIAAFKLRENMPIGCMVTLRGDYMYEFLDRLLNVSLPRVRDFRGVSSKSFDGRGNYTLGIKDQLIFPEIDYSKVDKTVGMNISITTTARTDAEGVALLKNMGMPFRQ
jgi:large subunit ribosomal protein L5